MGWIAVAVAAWLAFAPAAGAATLPQIPVLTTPAGEFQPARSETALAWEQNTRARPNQYNVIVQMDGSTPVQANRAGSSAAMGDFAGSQLVFQQYKGNPHKRGRSDLLFFNIASGARNKVQGVNTRQWEYWPSHSDGWLLYGRWKPKKEVRRLFLHHLETGERRLLDKTKGANRFIGPGQVQGNYAVWSTCRSRCNVFRYDIAANTKQMIDNPGSFQRAPSVTPGGTVYFSRGGKGCGGSVDLVRARMDGGQEVLVELQQGLDIRDTYAFVDALGNVDVYYERNACRTKAGSDIYRVRDSAQFPLTVAKEGTGTGTVSSSPAGLSCGEDCTQEFEAGIQVTLTATAASGSVFAGWSGGPCTGIGPCQVTMTGPIEVTAVFLPVGTITISKEAVPEGDPQDFVFDHDLGGLDFLLDDDPASATPDSRVFSPSGGPGTYFVQEAAAGGWRLTGLDCQDPDGGTGEDVGARRATIDLDPNEAILCTFHNTKQGTILVEKQTTPSGASQSFEFEPSYEANFFMSDNGTNGSGSLPPGTYTVSEVNIPTGWSLTAITCVGGGPNTSTLGATATIVLDPGETVVCTFQNARQASSITVEKQTTPDGSPQAFQFDPSYASNFALSDNGTHPSGALSPGTYTVTEINIPAGWSLTAITCQGGGGDTSTSGNTATIGLDPGENVLCTFNNAQQAPGSITIVKDAVPNDIQDFQFDRNFGVDFFLDDDPPSALPNQRTFTGLLEGAYSVTEATVPSGWVLTDITCQDPDGGTTADLTARRANIDLDPGEAIQCTFTNTKLGTIAVQKQTEPDGSPGDFTFTGDLEGTISDGGRLQAANQLPGSYTATEEDPGPGYTLSSISCDDANSTGDTSTRRATFALDPGETVTCTFTNSLVPLPPPPREGTGQQA